MTVNDIIVILPSIILIAWSLVSLVVDLWIPRDRKGITALMAAFGLAVSLGVTLALGSNGARFAPGFNGMAVLDGFAVFANLLLLGSGLLGIALAFDYNRRMGIDRSEYYVLLMISTAGMMLMVQAFDLIVVFLALEMLSIPLYVLAGFARPQVSSEESSLKYFILGAFASAIFLYGAALIYGGTAHTDFTGIVNAVRSGGPNTNIAFVTVGGALLLVGLAFKVAAVPFHMWTPDVYQGAPSPVTAWMAVSVKVAALAALMRVFVVAFPSLAAGFQPVLWGLAALTMVVGNLVAMVQKNIKRLLAYSSIAHVGYLLMAFVPYGNGEVVSSAISATLFYLLGYGLASFAAWGVVIAAEQAEGRGLDLEDYAGLGRKYPWMGIAMMVAMFSFTGIPMTLGFWGKFYVFQSAVRGGAAGLALIGLLASLFSAFYYLRVLVVMYMRPGEPAIRQEGWLSLVTIASAAAVVLLAFVPGPVFNMAAQAFLHLP